MVRLCLMRCFHPEKLMDEIRSFISFFLGYSYTEVPPFDFHSILKQTSPKIPVLFLYGPNVNSLTELYTFRSIDQTFKDSSIEYQPLGSIKPERIAKLIIRSACKGDWLLLDNLQLAIEDLQNLLRFVETMEVCDLQITKTLKEIAGK